MAKAFVDREIALVNGSALTISAAGTDITIVIALGVVGALVLCCVASALLRNRRNRRAVQTVVVNKTKAPLSYESNYKGGASEPHAKDELQWRTPAAQHAHHPVTPMQDPVTPFKPEDDTRATAKKSPTRPTPPPQYAWAAQPSPWRCILDVDSPGGSVAIQTPPPRSGGARALGTHGTCTQSTSSCGTYSGGNAASTSSLRAPQATATASEAHPSYVTAQQLPLPRSISHHAIDRPAAAKRALQFAPIAK